MTRIHRNNCLNKWRLKKGFTLKQLAQKTGFKDVYLVQLEKGIRKGTPNTWIKLAHELQLTIVDLFHEEISVTDIKKSLEE